MPWQVFFQRIRLGSPGEGFFGALVPLKRRFRSDVAGLQSVISRLPPIECVTLRFPDSFAPLSFDLGFDGGGWEFAHLLNIILERQCKSLEVIEGVRLSHMFGGCLFSST